MGHHHLKTRKHFGGRTKPAGYQKIAWRWKDRLGYRILKPGQPEYFTWKNGKRLSAVEEAEFEANHAWP